MWQCHAVCCGPHARSEEASAALVRANEVLDDFDDSGLNEMNHCIAFRADLLHAEWHTATEGWVNVNMGRPRLDWTQIPLATYVVDRK